MPHPHVESDEDWDFRAIYFDPPYPAPQEGRLEIGSERLRYAPVVLRMALAGDDLGDIRHATLLFTAFSAAHEMRISSTRERLLALAQMEERAFDGEYAAELVQQAEEELTGMALVQCLRAIGFALSSVRPDLDRKAISTRARQVHAEVEATSGRSALLADDAHAHLFLAEHLAMPDEEAGGERLIDLRRVLVDNGFAFLCAAVAWAYAEAWNPFTYERLRREIAEHAAAVDWLSPSAANRQELATEMLEAAEQRHAKSRADWEEALARGVYDIDAFFIARMGREETREASSEMLAAMADLRAREPTWQLIA
jgi:hypothetical protein